MDQNKIPKSGKSRRKSIALSVSFIDNTENSLYKRLVRYAKKKGISEQETIRYAVTKHLESVGY